MLIYLQKETLQSPLWHPQSLPHRNLSQKQNISESHQFNQWSDLPSPVPPPPPLGVINSRLSLANRALRSPKWPAVALFFWVLAIYKINPLVAGWVFRGQFLPRTRWQQFFPKWYSWLWMFRGSLATLRAGNSFERKTMKKLNAATAKENTWKIAVHCHCPVSMSHQILKMFLDLWW